MKAEIEIHVLGEIAVAGHVVLPRTRTVFGPPDAATAVPGGNPDVNSRALVLSGHADYPDVTWDETQAVIAALVEKFPDRDIYLMSDDGLSPCYTGRVT